MMATNSEELNYVVGRVSDFFLWKKNTLQTHKTNLELQISKSLSLWKWDKCVDYSISTQLSEMSLICRNSCATILGKWCCANHLLCQSEKKTNQVLFKEEKNPYSLDCKVSQGKVGSGCLCSSFRQRYHIDEKDGKEMVQGWGSFSLHQCVMEEDYVCARWVLHDQPLERWLQDFIISILKQHVNSEEDAFSYPTTPQATGPRYPNDADSL